MTQINVYRITPEGSLPLDFQAATLDELTPQLPEGFYTTFRTYDGRKRVLGLRSHLQRLYEPLTQKWGVPKVSKENLRKQIGEILQTYSGEVRVRLVMTKTGDAYVALSPLKMLSPEHYRLGVKAITLDLHRERPREKATSFISNSKNVRNDLSQSNMFEALLVKNDRILEGMTSNFFYIMEKILGTARKDVLLGVTRRTVLRVARRNGFRIVYRPLKREQVPVLSEAFLTSSSRGIVPIIQIDDVPVGDGSPGPITKILMDGYKDYVNLHAELI